MRPTLILTPLLLMASTVTVCQAQHSPQLEITDVRFWTLSEVTRIAIETNGEFRFRSDRLNNPDRLFFDLLGTKPRVGVKGVQTKPVGDKLLKRIRIAETQPGMTRVVLDLESAVEFTASQLSNPDRLMIELRPAGGPRVISANRPAPEAPKLVEKPVVEKPVVEKSAVEKNFEAVRVPVELREPPPVSIEAPPAPLPAEKQLIAEKPAGPALPQALGAKRNSTGDRTLIRALGLKVGRVVIDPGHGGYDKGSIGPGGLFEKDLVLDVALRLGKLIEGRLGSEVTFTRGDDTFVALERRTELANTSKADLFLSIHANSSPYPSVSGVETYHLNLTSARDALDLASRENAGAQKTIHELSDMIQKITQRDKGEESKEFASKMQAALFSAVVRSNPAAKNRGVKKAPFVVLIGATMPSILAEIGFVSNTREETLLKKSDHRQKLAEALYRGLSRYAETLSHFQVAAKD